MLSLMPTKCLSCRQPLMASAGEKFVCTRCTVRAADAARVAGKFATHVGAAAAGDVLRREFPATFKTLEAGYRSWRRAEKLRDDVDASAPGERKVVDFGAAQRRKAGA